MRKYNMKARVKATGKIVEVTECGQTFKDMRMDYMDMRGHCYSSEDLDFSDNTPFDYWTRFEHQAVIAAMQGILSNQDLIMSLTLKKHPDYPVKDTIVEFSKSCAHALVETYKKEERK